MCHTEPILLQSRLGIDFSSRDFQENNFQQHPQFQQQHQNLSSCFIVRVGVKVINVVPSQFTFLNF